MSKFTGSICNETTRFDIPAGTVGEALAWVDAYIGGNDFPSHYELDEAPESVHVQVWEYDDEADDEREVFCGERPTR